MVTISKSLSLAGRELRLETGRLAGQAGGAVLLQYGDTTVLATATVSAEPREGIDFFPLTVDYEERFYAVGRIPGGFIKREGRPSEKAILSARLIDRPIRPLFPKNYRNDVHVVTTVLSVDHDCPPNVVAMIGASAAITISGIPFAGPIGAVAMGLVDEEIVLNPTLAQSEKSRLELVVAGTAAAIMMVEAGAAVVPEETVLEAISRAHETIKDIVAFIEAFYQEALQQGAAKPRPEFPPGTGIGPLEEELAAQAEAKLEEAISQLLAERPGKKEREARLEEAKTQVLEEFLAAHPEEVAADSGLAGRTKDVVDLVEKKKVRRLVMNKGIRIDGRRLDEIRPIWCEVGVLPRAHGSGIFTRGETQVLSVVTLGAVAEEQILDGLGVEESKRYMHHYNMPGYSTGEAKPIRGPGRREIGHGALAERALESMIPRESEFPYTIRVVSEVLSSNGSTSMGSVCGSTLALMDAGVPLKAPVAGVAMGLIKDEDTFAVLTDIQGIEDALGDMDFKVAGTREGITALQMDIKVAGITREILTRALEQARAGRLAILEKMLAILPAPRPELSHWAPRVLCLTVDPDKIREIIGPGGKIIKKIVEETGAKIDVEDDGRVFISSVDAAAGERATEVIRGIIQDIQVGQVYLGRVTRITDFGAFVEVVPGVMGLPGKEGLVHISQLAEGRVAKVEDVIHEGEQLLVKAIGFDAQGKLRLSHKEALPRPVDGGRERNEPSGDSRPGRDRRGPRYPRQGRRS